MTYEKSVIDINISFENEMTGSVGPRRPKIYRKTPKDKITLIEPSPESKRTSSELNKRVQELERFRRESQSADISPLLVTALVKRTQDQLAQVHEVDKRSLKLNKRFRKAARIVLLLVSSCMRWRRYKKQQDSKTRGGNVRNRSGSESHHRKPQLRTSGIGFEARSFKEKSKIDIELREILTCLPPVRTYDQLKKVQRLCRNARSFLIFPVEREMDVARHVGYERYDDGRVIACQGRQPARFYYIISGRVSKVCVFNLAAGVSKMSFGELLQGCTTDPVELQNGTLREHSLICKGPVEVLVLERDDFLDLISCNPDHSVPVDYLRTIDLFRSFPMEKFLQEKDTVMTKYFAKDAVIVKNCFENPYFFIVKSGRCKVVREQDVLDMRPGNKLPAIYVHRRPRDNHKSKSLTKLLELSKAFSKDFSSDNTRRKVDKAEGQFPGRTKVADQSIFITKTPLPGRQKEAVEFVSPDVSSRKQNKPEKLHKRNSDSTVVPTRKALLQIAILKPGDMFGLESMMAKAAVKTGAIKDTPKTTDPTKRQVILISEGAECIMVNKRFFLKNACMTTLVQLRALREEYISVEEAREQIQGQQAWNLYKRDLVKQLVQKSKTSKR